MKAINYLKSNLLLIVVSIFIGSVIGYCFKTCPIKTSHDLEIHKNIDKDLPPSLRMYYYLNYYSDSLDLPVNYLYGIANTESSWSGPFDFKYKPNLKSPVGALGPMQIMPATAKMVLKKSVSKQTLMNDIQLNVRISALLVKKLYEKYGDWKLVFGAYNTGRPLINKYSEKVYNFEPKWSDSVIVNLNN